MEQRHVLENNRVILENVVLIVPSFNGFTFDSLDVVLKLFFLIILKLAEVALNEAKILSGERSDLDLHFGVKQELDCALVIRLDLSDPVLLGNGSRNRLPDRLLGLFQGVNLRSNNASVPSDEVLDLGPLQKLVLDLPQEPVLVGNVELVFKLRPP
jgi:hypothetical protein